ncbi:MAG: hypothetical protein IPN94_17450 [Sphingobacteriales bacterium]|nr:hypothetical protein [Sphingobacteriales bacterium]
MAYYMPVQAILVYRYDPTVGRWACYNKGLPVCMVTDLEIDYCRLFMHGTFGRGIWVVRCLPKLPLPKK